jgi:hypothetical protein
VSCHGSLASKRASHHATVSLTRTIWSHDLNPYQEYTVVFDFLRKPQFDP